MTHLETLARDLANLGYTVEWSDIGLIVIDRLGGQHIFDNDHESGGFHHLTVGNCAHVVAWDHCYDLEQADYQLSIA